MKRLVTTPLALVSLAVGMAVLLLVVAALQYHWIDRASGAERIRLERNLRLSAQLMARDIEQPLSELAATFGPRIGARGIDPEARIERAYAEWSQAASHPQMIAAIYRIGEAADGARRFTPDRGFVDAELPRESAGPPSFRARGGRGIPEIRGRWLILPARPGAPRRERVIIELDPEWIASVLMPALVARYFDEEPYRVTLHDRADGSVIYANGAAVDPQDADAAVPLFGFRSDRMAPGDGPPRRAARPRDPLSADPPEPPFRRFTGGSGAPQASWILLLQHPAGSLDRAVGRARRHNLLLASTVLLLLAGALAVALAAARRADQLAKQQMEFVAGVTHELNTPLSAIRATGQNLRDGIVDPSRVAEYGAAIVEQERRLSDLVAQVLGYAGLAAEAPAPRKDIDIAKLIDEAIADVARLLEETSARITRSIPSDLPSVRVNGDALRRAIVNLISNAARHGGPNASIVISASASATDLRIEVADDGAGIPADELRRIVQPFERGSRAVREQVRGSGLGLSIVRRIAERHGGSLDVESIVGEGTRVSLTIPRHAGEEGS